jgi:hypothetical protein
MLAIHFVACARRALGDHRAGGPRPFLVASGVGSSRRHKARVMAERVVYRVISYGEWTRPRMRNFREQSRRMGNGASPLPAILRGET